MINLVIEGVKLDLYPINLSYKKTNNAFTFGKLTLNRTQSFKMPKTPNNLKVFGANAIQTYGDAERIYFNAQLQGSGFVENGLLYVDSIEVNDITCIFIFGSLIKLKEVSNVKNIAEVLAPYDSYFTYVPTGGKLANETLDLYDVVNYRNNYPTGYGRYNKLMPSISIRGLITCANELYGTLFDVSQIPDYRIIQGTLKTASRNNVVFAKISTNEASPAEKLQKMFAYAEGTATITCKTGNVGTREGTYLIMYETLAPTELKFPADFPDDIFILDDKCYYDTNSGKVIVDVEFFGGYSFDTGERVVNSLSEEGTRNTIGEPLSGRTITIPNNKKFSFYRKTDFHNTSGVGGSSQNNYRGFFSGDATPFNYTFPVVSQQKISEEFYTTYLIDNLPKMSFIELYNSVAILQNKYITVQNGIITMVNYDSISDNYFIKNVISHTNLKREAITAGRSNYIQFEESENVKPANRLIFNYEIDNELLESEDTIYKFIYSEGEEYTDNKDLYLNNIIETVDDNKTKIELVSDVPTIALVGEGEFLKKVTLQENTLLRKMYNLSTQVEISVYMSLYDYMQVKETNVIVYNSLQWVWLSSSWNKNKAKFVLQRI